MTPLDDVVLGTGYAVEFPFLPKDAVPVVDGQVQAYKHVLPPDLGHPTLAIIGLVSPLGAIFPIAEMQVSRIFRRCGASTWHHYSQPCSACLDINNVSLFLTNYSTCTTQPKQGAFFVQLIEASHVHNISFCTPDLYKETSLNVSIFL